MVSHTGLAKASESPLTQRESRQCPFMKSKYFARHALIILCIVFFLAPFALRGARMSVQRMKNNVKDWLPADFPETADLEWFGRHFLGEQFVIVTWPGCSDDDSRYHKLVEKLQHEVVPRAGSATGGGPPATDVGELTQKPFDDLTEEERAEVDRQRAREIGDALGLGTVGDTYEDWGGHGEKWLRGDKDTWYFITPDGELYRWSGRNNLLGWLNRSVRRNLLGQRSADGELVATLGRPATEDQPNEFHADPRKVTARLFKSITTGPDMLEQLSAKDGPLWPLGTDDEFAAEEARAKALERLSGTLFGPDGHQTCIVLTLSEPGKRDLKRVIGRPVLGRSRGRLLELATVECGISAEDLKLGGPPVDNVAIDEEGMITLARLVIFSALVGITLSLLCFRSLKITSMIFFVGGLSAITSLGIVWWAGGTVDAIVMSMPSLVYVLGLSGAVHIINYYRDAVEEHGLEGASGRALAHGWKPCTLAAFTTALGLLSLNTSNIVPIRNFGFYSALGVMATLLLLFTFLPSALELWPPRFRTHGKKDGQIRKDGLQQILLNFWERIGTGIVRRHGWVTFGCLLVFAVGALGLPKLNTCVHLIKLFDADAKIIRDYSWLEDHLGKLVPMELVVRVQPEIMRPSSQDEPRAANDDPSAIDERFQLNFLERMEIAARIQNVLETTFGENGQGVVGRAMSVPTIAPDLPPPGYPTLRNPLRSVMNRKLEEGRAEYLATDYLKTDREIPYEGSELWRISLRLGALLDIDYGQFVSQLKRAVEPVLTAYETRLEVLDAVEQMRPGKGVVKARIAMLGYPETDAAADAPPPARESDGDEIDQTRIFAETLRDLMDCAGANVMANPKPKEADPDFYTSEKWQKYLSEYFDCVVLIEDRPEYDLNFLRQHAKLVIDARDHHFDPASPSALAAVEKGNLIHAVYTGVVPIVYKAQRTLLTSLIDSIGWAFVMIALVMMVLLRSGPVRPWTLLNFRAGLISMIPNVFPIVLIFGTMGHANVLVDIGTMMTASVAMGVAVDDTIHFLTWFRDGVAAGVPRHQAIVEAYRRCAAAMTQTTLIGGLGLAVFALSTFTPTQYFGTMMLALLVAALVGDLIFLPALLAGPLGGVFCPKNSRTSDSPGPPPAEDDESAGTGDDAADVFGTPHIGGTVSGRDRIVRKDRAHRPFRQ